MLWSIGAASILIAANTQVTLRVFFKEDGPHKYNVTELIIHNGNSAELKCPRQGLDANDAKIFLLNVIYGLNFDSTSSATQGTCPDTDAIEDLLGPCYAQPTCTVEAQDASTAAGCQNRLLRVQYICTEFIVGGDLSSLPERKAA